ncbi:MAG: YihY family inner membrane protein [Polaromonas sp.]|uniref:YhjD/YihY/BrkB family envelope integrity protein n=1 Tax=Polaromonas sp. TaxID=1869339 RepID=UPI001835CCD4|nr:YhjD/YihY/BrkB family envelope integrity protein [Polaromonas sp.]MBA3594465.1 YihY family inner membrane protein [Polaromonas sp.]
MTTSNRARPSLPRLILKRGREERLTQAAGGLTFAVMVSLVPLLAVSFALFARVPVLRAAGESMREHLLRGLLPADIARTVLTHLAQFTGNAGGLTQLGFVLLLASALMLLMSVENTLNRIWQVKKPRSVLQRLVLYLGMLLTGPVIIGASLWAASYLSALSGGMLGERPWLPHALNLGQLLLSIAGFACLFRFVPHTAVRWRNAIVGGLLAGAAFELGKHGFGIYLAKMPSYRTIYGAFAPLLAFLVWVYYSWLVTLSAALVSASLQRGKGQAARRSARA